MEFKAGDRVRAKDSYDGFPSEYPRPTVGTVVEVARSGEWVDVAWDGWTGGWDSGDFLNNKMWELDQEHLELAAPVIKGQFGIARLCHLDCYETQEAAEDSLRISTLSGHAVVKILGETRTKYERFA